jgi:hypothetical protein
VTTATPVKQPDGDAEGSDVMMLLIPGAMWRVLQIQGKSEGRAPGEVLSDALKTYLEKSGCQAASDYLWSLSR